MTRPFSVALKHQMVARLTGVNAVSAAQLARETGISQQNLSRWLSQSQSSPLRAADEGIVSACTVEQKARIIAHAAALAGDEVSRYLAGEGATARSLQALAGRARGGRGRNLWAWRSESASSSASWHARRGPSQRQPRSCCFEGQSTATQENEVAGDNDKEKQSTRSMSIGARLQDNATPSSSMTDYLLRQDRDGLPTEAPFAVRCAGCRLSTAQSSNCVHQFAIRWETFKKF